MPATSEKQKRFMDAAAHNPAFAKAAGVPQNVAKDFSESSKGLKFGKGAETRADLQKVNKPKTLHGKNQLFNKGGEAMEKDDIKQDKKLIKKAFGMHDKQSHEGKKTDLAKLAKGGSLFKGKESYSEELKEAKAIKSGKITPQQYAKGEKSEEKMAKGGRVPFKGEHPIQKQAKQGTMMPKMARGGGVEVKGKTKGKMIAMCGGGMSKKK